jgi:peptidyl-prolyl cis-trans isomerase B (cyclophilin B)
MEAELAKKKNNNLEAAAKRSLKSFEAKQNVADHRIAVRAKDNRLAIIVTSTVFVFALLSQLVYFNFGPGISPTACITFTQTTPPLVGGRPTGATVPDASLSKCRDWNGSMTINNAKLEITLHGKLAPQAVANFVDLSKVGFYNLNNCHRLTTSGIFVLQCGDPNGDGTGGPGYSWGPLENMPKAADGKTPTYKKGWLAMARQSNNGVSMGSQFFIVYADSNIPDDVVGGYTVFGEVTSGLSSLDPIINAGVAGGKTDGKPKTKTIIKSITLK